MCPFFQRLSDTKQIHHRSCGRKITTDNGNTNGSCIQYRNLDLTLKQSLKPFPDILHGFHRCDYCTNGKRQKQFVTEMPERLLHQLIPVMLIHFSSGIFNICIRNIRLFIRKCL